MEDRVEWKWLEKIKFSLCSRFMSKRFFFFQISMVIHYALMEGNNTVACFEVPAKITN